MEKLPYVEVHAQNFLKYTRRLLGCTPTEANDCLIVLNEKNIFDVAFPAGDPNIISVFLTEQNKSYAW